MKNIKDDPKTNETELSNEFYEILDKTISND